MPFGANTACGCEAEEEASLTLISEKEVDEKKDLSVEYENANDVTVEIKELKAEGAGGKILAGATCFAGKLLKPKETCSFEQDKPVNYKFKVSKEKS